MVSERDKDNDKDKDSSSRGELVTVDRNGSAEASGAVVSSSMYLRGLLAASCWQTLRWSCHYFPHYCQSRTYPHRPSSEIPEAKAMFIQLVKFYGVS